MAATRYLLRIAAFPPGPDLWRINWFGPITFPNRESRWSQPSVQICLSKIVDAAADPANILGHEPNPLAAHQLRCWVSVGTLMLLRVGDVWSEQTLVSTPDYELESFPELLIDDSTTLIVKAGSASEPGKFLIPFRDHPWHYGNTQANCMLVALPDGKRLVVPCMELIRFYFGSSSALLSRLFILPVERQCLFTRMEQSISGVHMKLDLADGIPRASAADVGRIAGGHAAWRAAKSISTSCSRASAAGRDAYPLTRFPFEGCTDLVAAGRWVGEDRGTFLVFSLRSCSHPFPFRSLRYQLGAANQKARTGTPVAEPDRQVGPRPRKPHSPTVREHDASKHLAPSERKMAGGRQFPDLERKRVWANRAVPPTPSVAMRPLDPIGDLAVGDPESDARIRPLVLSDMSVTESVPDFLRELLAGFRNLCEPRLTLLTASQADGWTIQVSKATQYEQSGEDAARRSNHRVAAFLMEHLGERTLLVAVEEDALAVLLCPVPSDDGDALERLPSVLRTYWSDHTSQERPDIMLDLGDEGAPARIGAWIRAHLQLEPEHRRRSWM